MTNNVAIDVAIGLIFIYLLYSLLITIIVEIIATHLGLRARNLEEAIDRMLNDEDDKKNFVTRLWDSFNLLKKRNSDKVKAFYNHPEIKYLGSSGVFKHPSSFKAVSFSKTLLYLLNKTGPLNTENIKAELDKKAPDLLGKETAAYVLSLYEEAEGNIAKFKMQLETWFDRTMEQATEWYKRKIQFILLILGFLVAWLFNLDTFVIVKKLSIDKDAREKIVALASAYVQDNPVKPKEALITDSADLQSYKERLDSLLDVKRNLESDIAEANNLFGSGSWLPDSVKVEQQGKDKPNRYLPKIEASLLPAAALQPSPSGYIYLEDYKWQYFFKILTHHLFGFIITAIALSLGAPFWFDLLNKIMKLRTAIKYGTETTNTNIDNSTRTLSNPNDIKEPKRD